MKTYTKQSLIDELKKIASKGWIENRRRGNDGGIGNTLEDLLGIVENNLPLPNAAEWELKSQRLKTTALTTLKHTEPSPIGMKLVSKILLPNYGWKHQNTSGNHPENEMSFRQTIHGLKRSDRGFMVQIDRTERKVLISFDHTKVSDRHASWLETVKSNIGLGELNPQPYWGFDDLSNLIGAKLHNCFYVQAQVKRIKGVEFYHYCKAMMLEKFNFDGFLKALEEGNALVDFDARTHHNHGTKFRMRKNCLPQLYEKATIIIDD